MNTCETCGNSSWRYDVEKGWLCKVCNKEDIRVIPLTADDPNRNQVLANADQIVKDYNTFGPNIMNGEFTEIILKAMVTWKQMAEERQEIIDYHNNAWRDEGYDWMVRG